MPIVAPAQACFIYNNNNSNDDNSNKCPGQKKYTNRQIFPYIDAQLKPWNICSAHICLAFIYILSYMGSESDFRPVCAVPVTHSRATPVLPKRICIYIYNTLVWAYITYTFIHVCLHFPTHSPCQPFDTTCLRNQRPRLPIWMRFWTNFWWWVS